MTIPNARTYSLIFGQLIRCRRPKEFWKIPGATNHFFFFVCFRIRKRLHGQFRNMYSCSKCSNYVLRARLGDRVRPGFHTQT